MKFATKFIIPVAQREREFRGHFSCLKVSKSREFRIKFKKPFILIDKSVCLKGWMVFMSLCRWVAGPDAWSD